MGKSSGLSAIVLCALAIAAVAAGCGSNACEDADARYEECGLASDKTTQDCTGEVECWAACAADANCDTLTKTNISKDYTDCIAACSK